MKMVYKVLYILMGLVILSMGSATLQSAGLGVDPFTAFNIGLSIKLGFTLGHTQLMINLILFAFVVVFRKKSIGIGTVLNMVLVGYFIQYFIEIFTPFYSAHSFFDQLIALVVGILLFTLGATMYQIMDMGQSPYDAIAPILSEKLDSPYKTVRQLQDVIVVVAAFLLSGPIGVGTVICAFGTGSLISKWAQVLPRP